MPAREQHLTTTDQDHPKPKLPLMSHHLCQATKPMPLESTVAPHAPLLHASFSQSGMNGLLPATFGRRITDFNKFTMPVTGLNANPELNQAHSLLL
jgi:hypothetical protein